MLGPVEALVGGRRVSLGGTKPVIVLAGLLLRAGEVVTVERLARWLWDGREPHRAKGPIHNYVSRLRKAIGDQCIRTERNGYRIVEGVTSDLARFTALATSGEDLLAAGEPGLAESRLREALALWRGPALANVDSDVLRRDELPVLDERRSKARDDWATAMLDLGEHAAVVPDLRRVVAEQPLRERPHEQLMLALHRSGRTADALAVHRAYTTALAEQLGLDPGPSLRRAHRAVLAGTCPAESTSSRETPRQLPVDTAWFVGRAGELDRLRAMVRTGGLAVVEGMAGVGKTSLAVHFGHSVASSFTDGQVYLDLGGSGRPAPLGTAAALAALLDAVGVPEGRLPRDLAGRSALWRSVTSGRRLFVLLDDAPGSDAVRPLLPGRGALVVVTGRSAMPGLAARNGGMRVPLRQLKTPEALDLLSGVIGADRVAAEPCAAQRLAHCCGLLPLAIRLLGEQLNGYPDTTLAEVVSELADEDRLTLLDQFDLREGDDTDLSAVFSHSYRALAAPVARLFRLTGFFAGPDDFAAQPVAAALAGVDPDQVRAGLDALVMANLLTEPRRGRYRFHDLVRTYAATLAVRHDSEEERAAIGDRLLAWYLSSTLNACRLLSPDHCDGLVATGPAPSCATFSHPAAAEAWCEAESANLTSLVDTASRWGRPAVAWRLAWLVQPYLVRRGRLDDWHGIRDIAVAAALETGDRHVAAALANGSSLRIAAG